MSRQAVSQADALSRVGRLDFERLIADHYRGQGYQVDEREGEQQRLQEPPVQKQEEADGSGSPLRLQRAGRGLLVLCRHGQPPPVGADEVQALLAMLDDAGAQTTALLITTGEFSGEALQVAAASERLQLIDGATLRAMIGPVPEPSGSRLPPPLPLPLSDDSPARLTRFSPWRSRLRARLAAWDKRQWALAALPLALLLVAVWGYPQYLAARVQRAQRDALAQARRPVFVAPAQPEAAPAKKERLTGLWNPLPIRTVADNRPRPRPPAPAEPDPELVRLTESNVWTEQELAEWQRRQEESIRTLERSSPASPI
ncbi:restriction endonuclease [Pseudoxanthomonas wuyuanensis]|uniref:Restriction endonuclease n=1 Tax=Pseudoxanthomonas wuyuanensis TaxID=1073196 RepID=A0A286CWX1_9GAMM|nr:restriction endonuclease [Pseudoxanthomonas wuyuanensis]SOD50902.1 Restriction endonuclease [Pseudoxanthomonas wuyuanensis]